MSLQSQTALNNYKIKNKSIHIINHTINIFISHNPPPSNPVGVDKVRNPATSSHHNHTTNIFYFPFIFRPAMSEANKRDRTRQVIHHKRTAPHRQIIGESQENYRRIIGELQENHRQLHQERHQDHTRTAKNPHERQGIIQNLMVLFNGFLYFIVLYNYISETV